MPSEQEAVKLGIKYSLVTSDILEPIVNDPQINHPSNPLSRTNRSLRPHGS